MPKPKQIPPVFCLKPFGTHIIDINYTGKPAYFFAGSVPTEELADAYYESYLEALESLFSWFDSQPISYQAKNLFHFREDILEYYLTRTSAPSGILYYEVAS